MREIKFRGQKTSTKEWVYGSLILNKSGAHTITQITDNPVSKGIIQGWCFGVMKESIRQFTGLKDKNGKEVYEGDIFLNGESKRIIEFRGGNYCATTFDKKQSILLSFIINSNPKNCVIGNIHEELIDQPPQ